MTSDPHGTPPRDRDDACPGVTRVHQAADGALARVRLPGGMVSGAQFGALAQAAATHGSDTFELTSRGNVQVRGLTDPSGFAEAVRRTGLLPARDHENVRNIVASALTGRRGGTGDARALVTALDDAIRSEPALAGLPGRFLFSVDDGRGDMAALHADIALVLAGDPGDASPAVRILLAGNDIGPAVPAAEAVAAAVALAARFTAVRGTAWRVAELPSLVPLLGADAPAPRPVVAPATPAPAPPIGWLEQLDGRVALGAGVPLGVLPVRTAEFLAALDAPLVVTPWRSVLICDLDEGVADVALRVLAPLGLIFDENSPWLAISACTGSPGCDRSLADVRADAGAAARRNPPAAPTAHIRRHFVGCERACGSPADGQVLIATADGYRLRRS